MKVKRIKDTMYIHVYVYNVHVEQRAQWLTIVLATFSTSLAERCLFLNLA